MRKTLLLTAAVLTAGSLAACKPFWQKDPTPEPTATATEPTVPAAQSAMPADPAKPADQTAPAETAKTSPEAKTEAKTDAPAVPAAK